MTEINLPENIIQEFCNLKSRKDVAFFLNVSEYCLINIIGIKRVGYFYDTFTIKKKNGEL